MPSFLQPDPLMIALFALRQGLFLLILLPAAALRAGFARGASRWLGLAALGLALLGLAARYLPPLTGVYSGAAFLAGAAWLRAGGGMVALLAPALLLVAAALAPGRRWWGIDLCHIAVFTAFLALWAWSGLG